MADFERRQFEIGLEFVLWSFAERNNLSKGSSKPKKDAQVIWVRGRQPHEFFNSNYLFLLVVLPYLEIFLNMLIIKILWNHQILFENPAEYECDCTIISN